jgi:spermidine/putrescine transport system permease protein
MVKRFFSRFYIGIILLFLYAPIVILIILSFNESKSRARWGGFTLQWYQRLFQNEDIMSALSTTLIIAFSSAIIATILGTAASIAMNSMKKTPRTILMAITNVPMLNADIVTGISLMLVLSH